jgi:UDP-N-acetylmuramoyl-L-alanyl-D-glutamate--2,6-diaminopimelate ligase
MEVSSHAIKQDRIEGLAFSGGIFTNLTHDHLDYHKTFQDYLNAKKRFFDHLPQGSFALSNSDDKNGKVMLQNCKATKIYYALHNVADFKAKILENSIDGLHMLFDEVETHFRFMGKFNAYNLLAVYGAAVLLDAKKEEVIKKLSGMSSVGGRFEYVKNNNNVMGIVDYAHTPDALTNVLNTISGIRNGNESVITVVGCGGDRDKEKRPKMAAIACKMSDRVILTSDNPRTEDPEEIIKDMKKGLDPVMQKKVLEIVNRKEAIKTAVALAKKDDIILIAGKGHETYQEINNVRHHFDDKEILNQLLIANN